MFEAATLDVMGSYTSCLIWPCLVRKFCCHSLNLCLNYRLLSDLTASGAMAPSFWLDNWNSERYWRYWSKTETLLPQVSMSTELSRLVAQLLQWRPYWRPLEQLLYWGRGNEDPTTSTGIMFRVAVEVVSPRSLYYWCIFLIGKFCFRMVGILSWLCSIMQWHSSM